MICSPSRLNEELLRIQHIFVENSFPVNVINHVIERKVRRFKEPIVLVRTLCPIYLKLPLLGSECHLPHDRILACIISFY